MTKGLARISVSVLALTLYFAGFACAQEAQLMDISPERPSVGSGPGVVPPRSLEVEDGVNLAYTKTSATVDLPDSLIRMGIGHGSELRFATNNAEYGFTSAPNTARLQFQDMSFGYKLALTEPNHIQMQAVVTSFSCPAGCGVWHTSRHADTSGSFDPSVILVWQQNLHNGVGITENIAAYWTTANGVRQTQWSPSVSAGRSVTKNTAWYAEYAPTVARGVGPTHIVDAGLAHNLSSTRQIDVRVGLQNDSNGIHNFISLGYSFRMDGFAGKRVEVN